MSKVFHVVVFVHCQVLRFLAQTLPEIARFSTKYFILSKVYTDESGIKYLYCSLSACTGDNPLAKARGLSPRKSGQTMV